MKSQAIRAVDSNDSVGNQRPIPKTPPESAKI